MTRAPICPSANRGKIKNGFGKKRFRDQKSGIRNAAEKAASLRDPTRNPVLSPFTFCRIKKAPFIKGGDCKAVGGLLFRDQRSGIRDQKSFDCPPPPFLQKIVGVLVSTNFA
jgi:hypothetical protein